MEKDFKTVEEQIILLIEYNKILNKMGFPKNYKKLLEYIS